MPFIQGTRGKGRSTALVAALASPPAAAAHAAAITALIKAEFGKHQAAAVCLQELSSAALEALAVRQPTRWFGLLSPRHALHQKKNSCASPPCHGGRSLRRVKGGLCTAQSHRPE